MPRANRIGPFVALAVAAIVAGTVLTGSAPGRAVQAPTLSIADVSVAEGSAGSHTVNVRVSLSAPAGGAGFTVLSADGTATAPSDYTQLFPTLFVIPAGGTFFDVPVQVEGDTAVEANETFEVRIIAADVAILDDRATVTLLDDDGPTALDLTVLGAGRSPSGTREAAASSPSTSR